MNDQARRVGTDDKCIRPLSIAAAIVTPLEGCNYSASPSKRGKFLPEYDASAQAMGGVDYRWYPGRNLTDR